MPLEFLALPHDSQIERTERIGVAIERPSIHHCLDQVAEGLPLVELAERTGSWDHVIGNCAHGITRPGLSRVFSRPSIGGKFEVGRAETFGVVCATSQFLGIGHEGFHAGSGHKPWKLHRAGVNELAAGISNQCLIGRRCRILQGIPTNVDTRNLVGPYGLCLPHDTVAFVASALLASADDAPDAARSSQLGPGRVDEGRQRNGIEFNVAVSGTGK